MSVSRLPGDSMLFSIEGPLDEEYVRRVLKACGIVSAKWATPRFYQP
jgi:hypothetical protein